MKEELIENKGSCEEAAAKASSITSEEQETLTDRVEKLSTDLVRSKQLVAVAQEGQKQSEKALVKAEERVNVLQRQVF